MVFNTTHSWKWNGIITIQNEKQQEGDIPYSIQKITWLFLPIHR